MTRTTDTVIAVQGLSIVFGSVVAVDSLDLEVQRGEVFGFLGPNGAGKTSTIRALLDLQRADQGEVRLLGQRAREGAGGLRRRLGFLPGDLDLFPHLTGSQTLDLFSRLNNRPPVKREEVLERLSFPRAALGRAVGTYSTGMRQILGLVLAFQHDPLLLILDEPTTGLDPLVRVAFVELVKATHARGRTIFMSSHVLSEVQDCVGQVGLIHKGRLLQCGSLESLRQGFPRRVILRFEDGRVERRLAGGPPAELLDRIQRDGLVDLEIRPADLKDVFLNILGQETESQTS